MSPRLREGAGITSVPDRRASGPCGPESQTTGSADAHDGVLHDHAHPTEAAVEWQFPAAAIHARMARKWVEAWLSQLWPDREAAQSAALVVSEVAGNAVLHGMGPICLAARLDDGRLCCEISDQSPQQPNARAAEDDDEGGRGLLLVAALVIPGSLSVRARASGGKVVAFEISSRVNPADCRGPERRRVGQCAVPTFS